MSIVTLCDMIDEARNRLDDRREQTDYAASNLELLEEAAESSDDDNLLWSDAALTLYANRAVREIAFRTLCLRDSSSTADLTSFALSAGDTWQELDERILRILRVTWDGKRLKATSERDLDRQSDDWESDQSEPTHFLIDGWRIRPYPEPAAAGTLRIQVYREPIEVMKDPRDEPEIPKYLRDGAVNWMCHEAMLKNDPDTQDRQKAADFLQLFDAEYGPRPTRHQLMAIRSIGTTARPPLQWF